MLTIKIKEKFESQNDVVSGLEHISRLIEAGYTSGINPNWEMKGETERALICTIEGCPELQAEDGEFCEYHLVNQDSEKICSICNKLEDDDGRCGGCTNKNQK